MRVLSCLVFWLLTTVAFGAAQGARADCLDGSSLFEAISSSFRESQQEAKKPFTGGSSEEVKTRTDTQINLCLTKLKQYIDAWDNPSLRNGLDCAMARAYRSGTIASTGKIDLMIGRYVSEANCFRLVGSAIRNGSTLEGFPSSEEVARTCSYSARLTELPSTVDGIYERVRLTAAQKVYLEVVSPTLRGRAECEDKKGAAAELKARELLGEHPGARAKPGLFNISCLDRFRSFRGCHYAVNAPPKLVEMDETNPALYGDAPARMENGCSGHCLRTVTSRGCMEVLTAGHCTNNLHGKPVTIRVYDRANKGHSITASKCTSSFQGDLRVDYAICFLDQSVDTNPVYVATYDSSITGPDCADDGHLMRCGPDFWAKLSTLGLDSTIFPANGRMSHVTGAIYFDKAKHTLYHDLMTARGASGAGLMVTIGNRRVIVGTHSWGQPMRAEGGGAVIDFATVTKLSVWEDPNPSPAVSPGASKARSFWHHNGSIMYLVADGSSRELAYSQPRKGLLDLGVRPDTVLFKGQVVDSNYIGTARIFRGRCGEFPFKVSGPILDGGRRVALMGETPRVDKSCQIIGKTVETLEFQLIDQQ